MAAVLRSTVRWTLSSLSVRGVARWRPLSSETTESVVKTGTGEEVAEYVSPDELVSVHHIQNKIVMLRLETMNLSPPFVRAHILLALFSVLVYYILKMNQN